MTCLKDWGKYNKIKFGMKKKFVFIFLLLIPLILLAQKKKSPQDLPEVYRKWFQEEVVYIITKTEKEVFLQLETDRERDIFIEAFWKQRDPTPGISKNEYKKEHYRRISYANKHFRPGGWRTDMGRVYIILGPPMNIHRHTSYTRVYPTEIWFYQQAPRGGLPPAFNVVFFDRKGIGEYVLYSPLNDGPQSLLIGYQQGPQDYFGAYKKLYDYNAFLAQVSLSLIPGEATSPGQPTMASDMLLQKINRVPQKEVEDIYAEKFLKFKDIIEVEYTANYVRNNNLVQIITDDSDTSFVNYFIELDRLSVNLYEDTYYTDLKTNGVIKTLSGQVVYQFEKNYSINLNKQQFGNVRDSSFAIYDTFPLIPGNYKFSLLLKNVTSKEFTSFEKDISISHDAGNVQMTPPLLAYDLKRENVSSFLLLPFRIKEGQLICQPENIFLKSDTLYVFFQIRGLNEDLRKNGKIHFAFYQRGQEFPSVSKKILDYAKTGGDILADFALRDFPASDYKLVISVHDENEQQILTESKFFSVSPVRQIARPQIFSKITSSSQGALIPYIKGVQHLNKGNVKESRELLERAYHRSPAVIDFALGLSRAYLLSKQYGKIETILSPYLESEKPEYEVFFHIAEAKKNLGQNDEAIKYYRDIIIKFGLRINILNSLGYCYYKVGNSSEARIAWEKSLEINSDQPKIKRMLDAIKKK